MKKITQGELAEILNVSRNTVTRVLNNQPGVAEHTRRFILEKAKELGCISPSMRGRRETAAPQHREVALLCFNTSLIVPFWIDVIHGLERQLAKQNISLRLSLTDPAQVEAGDLPDSLFLPNLSGIAVAGPFPHAHYLLVKNLGLPMVSYDTSAEFSRTEPFMDVITLENTQAIRSLTERLIEKGHRRLAFAGSATTSASFAERKDGFDLTLCRNRLEPVVLPSLLQIDPRTSALNEEQFYRELSALPEEARPTAYVCANDELAILLLRQRQMHPELMGNDVFITGFDNSSTSPSLLPLLDGTAEPQIAHVGRIMGLQLCNRLEDPALPWVTLRLGVSPIFRERLQ